MAMIKQSWCTDINKTAAYVRYIMGDGKKKKIEAGEVVYPSPSIADKKAVAAYMAKHRYFLDTRGIEGRRKSKRTDLRLIMSFVGKVPKNAHKLAKQFLDENFPDHLATWAIHSKPVSEYKGGEKNVPAWHFHFVICPRAKTSGNFLQTKKSDCQSAPKIDPPSASNFDPPKVCLNHALFLNLQLSFPVSIMSQ
ncbi:hypothetical protein, partial [Mariprofundus micogutta]|uniref:hypothetical protein n=1 Tax=Mariprofundus micogutta TaxID=1921010 RepID=UPI00116029C6